MFEVRTLKPGEKVSVPGIYAGIDIDYYHGDCTDGPGISSSGLRTIEDQSPLHYWDKSYLNPNRDPPDVKPHFEFGKAAHWLFLGEAEFAKHFVVRPEKWKDWRTDAAKQWRDEQLLSGKGVLLPDEVDALRKINRALAADPLVQAGVLQGLVEHSIFWKDPATGVWLKIRPDVIPTADGVVVDIKTTTDASPDAIQRTIAKFGYHMQAALIGMGLKRALGISMTDFLLVWVEKTRPYAVNVSPVDPQWIYWGERQIRRAINTFHACLESGEWPGYRGEITTSMPKYLRDQYEREDKGGLLPPEDKEIAA